MGRDLGGKLRCSYREEAAYYGHSKAADSHVKRLSGWQASLLKEIGRISTERIAVEGLNDVDANDNNRPAQIGPLKAGPIGCRRIDRALMFRCDYHQGDILLNVEVDVFRGGEAFDNLSGVVQPTLSNEPPR